MKPDKKVIAEFYENYKKNLDRVIQLEKEQRTQGSDLMQWIEKYKDRAEKIHVIFDENEAAIEAVLNPILSGEVVMDADLAQWLLDEILAFRYGFYGDSLASYEVLKRVVAFYEEYPQDEPDNYIIALGLLGVYEEVLGTGYHLEQSTLHHTKTIEYKDLFPVLKTPEAQRRVFFAFHNRLVSEMKRADFSIERIHQYTDEAVEFYSDEKNREVKGFPFDDLMEGAIVRTTFATLTLAEADSRCPQDLMDKACKKAMEEYEKYTHLNKGLEKVSAVCHISYVLAAYRSAQMTADEAFENLYTEYLSEVSGRENEQERYLDDKYVEVISSYSPEMLCIIQDTNYSEEKKAEIIEAIVIQVMNFFASIPPGRRNDIANAFTLDAFRKVLPYYTMNSDNLESIMKAVITRESTTAIHTNMVKAISTEFVKTILAKKPEYFIGTMDCSTVEDVHSRRKEFLESINLAAFCHDIGKLAIADIINIQYRKITDTEYEMIKEHSLIGADLLERIPYLKPYAEIAYGHHKSYDDKFGYPMDFSHNASKKAIWIDIITISDCIDAATDAIGRIYKKAKEFDVVLEELVEGAGTRYNPCLVKLLQEDKDLQKKICFITSEGRDSYMYNVYRHMDK